MSKLLHKLKANRRNIINIFYFVVTIAIVVVFLPNDGRFKYEFQKGKVWMHDDLVAQFDFPIYKTDLELINERNQLLAEFNPIFRKDTLVRPHALAQFEIDFQKAWTDYLRSEGKNIKIPANKLDLIYSDYKNIAMNVISYVYENGIIDKTEEVHVNSRSTIVVLLNNVAYDYDFNQVITRSKATTYVRNVIRQEASTVCAELMPVWKKVEVEKYLSPNLLYDNYITQKHKHELLTNLSVSKGMIQVGERIISRGEMVTSEKYQIIDSMRKEYEHGVNERNVILVQLGNIIIVASIFLALFIFINNFSKDILESNRKILFILSLIAFMVIISTIILKRTQISIFIIPFVIVPIFVKTFFDTRTALFVHLTTIILVGFFTPNGFEFIFLNFVAGIVAVSVLANNYLRGRLFVTVALVYSTYVTLYMGLVFVEEGQVGAVNGYNFLWFLINALLLLASYQLIYLFEKIFGFLSDATLIEISDTNMNLLRQLAENAPGTFQHSLQVANLAQSAAYKVNANALLVRAGALYHDIGKIGNPMYFIENQPSDFNPHKNIEPLESAAIIINHVIDGEAIARKARLPEAIVHFIRSHHGTSPVRYFLSKHQQKYGEHAEGLEKFNYPGPIPASKEVALVMMADAIEAASRSLKEVSEENISTMVESIIQNKLNEGQFANADLTFKDIAAIKSVFKKKLFNIYHARIAYPVAKA